VVFTYLAINGSVSAAHSRKKSLAIHLKAITHPVDQHRGPLVGIYTIGCSVSHKTRSWHECGKNLFVTWYYNMKDIVKCMVS